MQTPLLVTFPDQREITSFLKNHPLIRATACIDSKIINVTARIFSQLGMVSFTNIASKSRDIIDFHCKAALQQGRRISDSDREDACKHLTLALEQCGVRFTPRAKL